MSTPAMDCEFAQLYQGFVRKIKLRKLSWITGNYLFIFTPNVQANQVKKRKGSVNKHGQEHNVAADSS